MQSWVDRKSGVDLGSVGSEYDQDKLNKTWISQRTNNQQTKTKSRVKTGMCSVS